MLEAVADAILAEVGRTGGRRLAVAQRTPVGESRSTFIVGGDAGEKLILKIEPQWRADAH